MNPVITIHPHTPLKDLIGSSELIRIFLEEILLISPYELSRGDDGPSVLDLRVSDVIGERVSMAFLIQWFGTYPHIFDDLEITAQDFKRLHLSDQVIYCGSHKSWMDYLVERGMDRPQHVYHPSELGMYLTRTHHQKQHIICCFAHKTKTLSAALQLRQQGHEAQALIC